MLVDPVYRIYVALSDTDLHEELSTRLENSRYHYSPSLGLSECIAEISAVEMHSVEQVSADGVDGIEAATYDDSGVRLQPGLTVNSERAPMYMEAIDGSRRTTDFGNLTYTADDELLPVVDLPVADVGPHLVRFY
jgi:CRISPR-associated protein Cas5h